MVEKKEKSPQIMIRMDKIAMHIIDGRVIKFGLYFSFVLPNSFSLIAGFN